MFHAMAMTLKSALAQDMRDIQHRRPAAASTFVTIRSCKKKQHNRGAMTALDGHDRPCRDFASLYGQSGGQ